LGTIQRAEDAKALQIIEIKDLKDDSERKETPAQEPGGTTPSEVKK